MGDPHKAWSALEICASLTFQKILGFQAGIKKVSDLRDLRATAASGARRRIVSRLAAFATGPPCAGLRVSVQPSGWGSFGSDGAWRLKLGSPSAELCRGAGCVCEGFTHMSHRDCQLSTSDLHPRALCYNEANELEGTRLKQELRRKQQWRRSTNKCRNQRVEGFTSWPKLYLHISSSYLRISNKPGD